MGSRGTRHGSVVTTRGRHWHTHHVPEADAVVDRYRH